MTEQTNSKDCHDRRIDYRGDDSLYRARGDARLKRIRRTRGPVMSMRLVRWLRSSAPWPMPVPEAAHGRPDETGPWEKVVRSESCIWYVLWDGSAVRLPVVQPVEPENR